MRVHITYNHYADILTTIFNEIEIIESLDVHQDIDKKRWITYLLTQLSMYNNLFHFESRSEIRSRISDFEHYIRPDLSEVLYDAINFNPDDVQLGECSLQKLDTDTNKLLVEGVKTNIGFVIPYLTNENSLKINEETNKATLLFNKIRNLHDDPIYHFLDSTELTVNGMPLSFISDSLGKVGETTRVEIILDYFFHPDFEIIDNEIKYIDDPKEKAKRGGYYNQYIDKIVDVFWSLNDDERLPFNTDELRNCSNITSNCLVSYFSKEGEILHHKAYVITNFNSYYNAKEKFIDQINSHYYYDKSSEIKDFIFSTIINSKKSFLDFCYTLLEITLKKSIEFGGLHIPFWNNSQDRRTPIQESIAQKIIFNQIRYLAQMKGVLITKEPEAADGNLDFHFSYTKNNELFIVCVELKNAHHQKLIHGINAQLPLYMTDIGTRMGIFLVLWYKGKEFEEPKRFQTINDLEIEVKKNTPKKLTIKPLTIDCTKKEPPSKSESSSRL